MLDDHSLLALFEALKWPIGLLIAVLGYFLRDAHHSFKADVARKADAQTTEAALRQHREDMRAMEERYREETARIERQYEERFDRAVQQLGDRVKAVETNLIERMDLIRQLIDRRM